MTPYPLGRIVQHDPRSLRYLYPRRTDEWSPVRHLSKAGILDQGALGACTGYAAAHRLGFDAAANATDTNARNLYSIATRLDEWEGEWPPDDTGSSGLAVAKAAKQEGFIAGYQHITEPGQFAAAIQQAPVLVGTSWYRSMFTPDADGLVTPDATDIVGGHEYLCDEVTGDGRLGFMNSWGADWGLAGRFYMERDWFLMLLADRGDATVFTSHTPVPDEPVVDIDTPEPTPPPDAPGCLTAVVKLLTGRKP